MLASILIATVTALLAPSQVLAQCGNGQIQVCPDGSSCYKQMISGSNACSNLQNSGAGTPRPAIIRLVGDPLNCVSFRGSDCTEEPRKLPTGGEIRLPFTPGSVICSCK